MINNENIVIIQPQQLLTNVGVVDHPNAILANEHGAKLLVELKRM